MFEEFYGLTDKPFQLTPDPDFYFRSVTHRKALSYLGYGLAQGEGFIVITGEVGAGKSTLVAHMMASIDSAQLTAGQVVTSALDGEEIIHVVARSFGLDIEGHDKATALGAIESFLHDEARAGRRCLLIVDEAQNLAVKALEELRMLSNFQLGNHPLLQTLLLGQPEFRTTLQSHEGLEQLRQRVIAAHHLDAMQANEIAPYIMHRLKKVGWDGNPEFDQNIFASLYEAARGIPRRVNQIANRMLLLGAVEQTNKIDASILQAVLEEMAAERLSTPAPQKAEVVEAEAVEAAPVQAAPTEAAATPEVPAAPPPPVAEAVPQIDLQQVEALLAERDNQIAELQQAVVELHNQHDAAISAAITPEINALREQIAKLEAKNFEQERTVRHTLTMLIEWIESEMSESQAA